MAAPMILPKPGVFELEEKRSRFLGYCAPVPTQGEARRVLAGVRAAHPRANHNVYAYAVSEGNITRMSDDGEPHGTAGMPVLGVFQKSGVIDYICVVTRYFGGTLLGAGGLARAYTKAAKGALENAGPTAHVLSKLYRVTCPYARLGQTKYNFEKWGVEILEISYTDHCALTVRVTEFSQAEFLRGTGYTVDTPV